MRSHALAYTRGPTHSLTSQDLTGSSLLPSTGLLWGFALYPHCFSGTQNLDFAAASQLALVRPSPHRFHASIRTEGLTTDRIDGKYLPLSPQPSSRQKKYRIGGGGRSAAAVPHTNICLGVLLEPVRK